MALIHKVYHASIKGKYVNIDILLTYRVISQGESSQFGSLTEKLTVNKYLFLVPLCEKKTIILH